MPEQAQLPPFIYLALFVYLLIGCLGLLVAGSKVVRWRRLVAAGLPIKNPGLQLGGWLLLLLFSSMLWHLGHGILAFLGLLLIQPMPRTPSISPQNLIKPGPSRV